jgi:hypothetical protein
VAHGVYSWVPPEVRDKLMEVCRGNLAPQGVSFISYNAYPGWHLRHIARDIMLFHVSGISGAEERVREGRALLAMLADSQADATLAAELRLPLERDANVVYHDDLTEYNDPVYFHEFVDHARGHGLRFLSEATLAAPDGLVPEQARRHLEPLQGDPVRWHQYLDFVKLRRFHETLLCAAEAPVVYPPSPESARGLFASSKAQAGPEEPGGAVEFTGENGASAKTAHRLAIACLSLLGREWPRRFAFDELLARLSASAHADPGALCEILWHTCRAGLVELHAHRGRFAACAGEYPVASALARHDLKDAAITATLAHAPVQVDDGIARQLVLALDGTRNRGALALQLDVPLAAVEEGLARLARLPLLEA